MTEGQVKTREEALAVIKRLHEDPMATAKSEDLLFHGISLRGVDFSGLNLSGADFSGTDLSGADFTRANLFKANFQQACLVRSKLTGAELSGANLSEANLEEAQAQRAGLGMAVLKKARMFSCVLRDASLTKADLSDADLRHSDLTGVRLRESVLRNADLTVSCLKGGDLSRCDLTGAIFNNADLRDARLRQITGYKKAQWYGVDIRDVNFAGAYMLRRFIVDENYLKEFRDASPLNGFIYRVWLMTSNCGRSLPRWFLWILLIVAVFGGLYSLAWSGMDSRSDVSWLSPFYYSVVTITTLGYGDVVPVSTLTRLLAICEVFIGYVMLGGLLSIFNNKMARRGE
jgi:uncharacterized protein YjbI with pentapeptide repeats